MAFEMPKMAFKFNEMDPRFQESIFGAHNKTFLEFDTKLKCQSN